jgi:hypothetical protein
MSRREAEPLDGKRQRTMDELKRKIREAPRYGHLLFFDVPVSRTMAVVVEQAKSRHAGKRVKRGA